MKFISCWASPVKHLHAYMQPLKIPFFYEHCLCHYHRHCLCYCHNHWHLRCNFFLISRHGHWLSLLSYCHRQCFFCHCPCHCSCCCHSPTSVAVSLTVTSFSPPLSLCLYVCVSLWLSFCLPMRLSVSLIPLYCFFDCLSLSQSLSGSLCHSYFSVTLSSSTTTTFTFKSPSMSLLP